MIDKITKDFIDKMVIEVKKDDNKKKVREEILNPILNEFTEKIYPYINILFMMYSINLILIIIILILTVFRKK
jgi:hypothetical protein